MYCKNMVLAYTKNVLDVPGLNMWTTAAASITFMSTSGTLVADLDILSKHIKRSDFVPSQSFPPREE